MSFREVYKQLKNRPLPDIAEDMRAGLLPQPVVIPDGPNGPYPSFPDALNDVVTHGGASPRCSNCMQTGYYYPADRAYAPGHCYSEAGVTDFTRITGICEFCFDGMFQVDDIMAQVDEMFGHKPEDPDGSQAKA
jgi:hypothetical protein